jgi:hypothetical protein
MTYGILRASVIVGLATAAISFVGNAYAEQAGSQAQWKTPQVVGSAPVKEEPKATEAQAPRAVSVPYGAKNMNPKSEDK